MNLLVSTIDDQYQCVEVCPTGATTCREDGIVHIDADKCMGCRYCVVACSYQSRVSNSGNSQYFPGQGRTPHENLGKELYPHQKGTVGKCNFCMERIDRGLKRGERPGTDREATPACVVNCPTKAIVFGDLDDPTGEPSRLIRVKKGKQLHSEYGNDPSIYYLD